MGVLYFLIVLIATTAGAVAGVGGGVLIKPALDMLNHYSIETIGVLSSAAVLAMAVVSTVRRFAGGIKIDRKIILLAVGAAVGGFAGKEIFYLLLNAVDGQAVKIIQAVLIAVLMVVILFKNKFARRCISNNIAVLSIGFVLGILASFLGIGGGPVNVAVLYILLNMNIKKAAVGSIFIILLAQASKIATISLSQGFASYNLEMLWYMIPAGITGGLVGSYLHKKCSENTIQIVFNTTVAVVIAICIYNIVSIIV